jgi:hypothetical protein
MFGIGSAFGNSNLGGNMIFGVFLTFIGLLWLLANIGLISVSVDKFIWPVIIIAVGLSLLIRERKGSKK